MVMLVTVVHYSISAIALMPFKCFVKDFIIESISAMFSASIILYAMNVR